ncbi:MAG: DUF721 domain-containing protein [Flavobacteriales bacterium]|jgi:hypothetical protein|nr:DUF721 domain-containing protein [Flavobacteriales bacterium]|tara:strand:- start:478 stop:774 length:297 start_codon:yes stop_codon:yes gene_type:complete
MRKASSNTNSLSSLIRKILKNPKISERLDNLDVLEVWDTLIGSNLQKYVTDSKVYKGKLFIKLKSSTLRNEFSYKKTDLIKEINSRLGKKIIEDIIFK